MTHFYGIKPWEMELLTERELLEYLTQHDEYRRQEAEAAKRGR